MPGAAPTAAWADDDAGTTPRASNSDEMSRTRTSKIPVEAVGKILRSGARAGENFGPSGGAKRLGWPATVIVSWASARQIDDQRAFPHHDSALGDAGGRRRRGPDLCGWAPFGGLAAARAADNTPQPSGCGAR